MDIEQRALELVRDIDPSVPRLPDHAVSTALCRAIEAHDAFRQEVSEAVRLLVSGRALTEPAQDVIRQVMERFIIWPKTDPLVEALRKAFPVTMAGCNEATAAELRRALPSCGLEIREVGE